MNDVTGVPVRAERIVKRLRGLKVIVTGVKRNDAHDCFDKATNRYGSKLPEVVVASGIKSPGLTDRRKGGRGEPVRVECN